MLGESPLPDTERMELQLVILPLQQNNASGLVLSARGGGFADMFQSFLLYHLEAILIWYSICRPVSTSFVHPFNWNDQRHAVTRSQKELARTQVLVEDEHG